MRKRDAAVLLGEGLRREVVERAFLRGIGDATRPSVVHVNLTHRCNYRCGFCVFGADQPQRPANGGELDAEAWGAVLAGVRALAPRALVMFIGGEPFLRTDILDIAGEAEALGLRWGVVTNGFRLARDADRLAGMRPMTVDVSLDGATAPVHDASRGVPGSFARVTEGLRQLCKARQSAATFGGGRFSIRLKTTVHRHNLHELEAMVALTERLGADSIDFTLVRGAEAPWSAAYVPDAEAQARLQPIVARLKALKRAGAPIESSLEKLDQLAETAFVEAFHGVTDCRAGLRNLQIDPTGQAQFCWLHPALGSVAAAPVEEVWRSPEAQAARRRSVNCANAGTEICASSCLAHRTFGQNVRLALRHIR